MVMPVFHDLNLAEVVDIDEAKLAEAAELGCRWELAQLRGKITKTDSQEP